MLLSNTIMFRNFTIGLSFCTMVYGFIKFVKFIKFINSLALAERLVKWQGNTVLGIFIILF